MDKYKFKGIDYYMSIKGKALKSVESIWCNLGYRNPDKIGYDMYLIAKYKPSSVEEFYETYINDYTTIDDPLHGRNLGMIETLAIAFKEDAEKKNPSLSFDVEDYMDIIVLHAVVETWEGHRSEEEIRKLLVDNGNTIINCDDIYWKVFPEEEKKGKCFDAWASIDIVSGDGENINRLIQIKPISTFTSNNTNTIKDRYSFDKHNLDGIDFIKKHMPYKVKEDIQVRYMLYHKNDDGTLSWYYQEKNGQRRFDFTLKSLLDRKFVNEMYVSNKFDKITTKTLD